MPFRSVVTAAGGAGSVAGTATDAARWMQAWGSGSLLSRATYREMLRDAKYTRAMHAIVTYGLGVQLISIQGQQTLGHSGRYLGFQNAVRYLPGPGISIAILTNQSTYDPGVLMRRLIRIVAPGQGDELAARGCHAPPSAGRALAMDAAVTVTPWSSGSAPRAGSTATGAGRSTRSASPSGRGSSTTRPPSTPWSRTPPSTACPKRRTFEAWAERTPSDFTMAVKASRYLTHIRRLRDPEEAVDRLVDRALRPRSEAGAGPRPAATALPGRCRAARPDARAAFRRLAGRRGGPRPELGPRRDPGGARGARRRAVPGRSPRSAASAVADRGLDLSPLPRGPRHARVPATAIGRWPPGHAACARAGARTRRRGSTSTTIHGRAHPPTR